MELLNKIWILYILGGVLSLVAVFLPLSIGRGSYLGLVSASGYFYLFGLLYLSLEFFDVFKLVNSFYLFEELDMLSSFLFPLIISYSLGFLALIIIIIAVKLKNNSESIQLLLFNMISGAILLFLLFFDYILIIDILNSSIIEIFGVQGFLVSPNTRPHVGFYFILFSGITVVLSSIYTLFMLKK